MREILDELRVHHALHKEMAAQRATADHQIIDTVAALTDIVKELQSLSAKADSMPERVQTVLNSADITALHRKLAEALTVDIWARLGTHSDSEAERLSTIATRIEASVHAAVRELQDANAGKPTLPSVANQGRWTSKVASRTRYCYIYLIRLSNDLQPVALTFASVCVGLCAVTIMLWKFSRISIFH